MFNTEYLLALAPTFLSFFFLVKIPRVVFVICFYRNLFSLEPNKMIDYEVTVFTADTVLATTFNNVFIKLVGTDGDSERQWLVNLKDLKDILRATVRPSLLSTLAGMIC